jgi:hypothetical protein
MSQLAHALHQQLQAACGNIAPFVGLQALC